MRFLCSFFVVDLYEEHVLQMLLISSVHVSTILPIIVLEHLKWVRVKA